MDKILYLHGYKDVTTAPLVQIMRQSDYEIVAPKIDYDSPAWDKVVEITEKEKPIAIVGHSLGGYFGYYLSQKFGIPALIISPALYDKWDKKQPVPADIKNLAL